jgi:copper resistance protein D
VLILRFTQTASLTALGTMLGTAMFLLVICQPLAGNGGAVAFAARRCAEQLRHVWVLAYVASVVSLVLWFCAECVTMTGRTLLEALAPAQIWMVLGQTQFGRHYALHLGLMVLPGAYLTIHRRGKGEMSGAELFAACVLSAGLLSHMSFFSHAAAMSGTWSGPLLTSYAFHLVAAGTWLGGLLPLLMILLQAHRHRDAAWTTFCWQAVRRFSPLGSVCVGTLLATGAVNALLLVGTWTTLTRSDYGRLLLAKILLFAAMVGIAAVNKFRLTPDLAAPSRDARGGNVSPALRLLRSVAIEASAGLAILAMAATLGSMPPAIE